MTDVDTNRDAASLVGALADPARRGAALSGLVALGRSARAAVRAGLGDGRWEVRRACVYWHLRFGNADDARWLTPLACDPKSKVRHAAIVALAQAPGAAGSDVVALLMERALTDESLHVRRQAVLLLAWQLPHPDLEGFFAGLLATERDAKLHKFAGIGLLRSRERVAARARGEVVLSAAERREFEQRGVVRLEQAVDAGVVAQLRERLVARLARRRHVPQHAGLGYALKPSSLADLTKDRAFAEFWGARVVGALDELLGAGAWQEPAGAGQILFLTLPAPEAAWVLPHKMWHLDYPAPGGVERLPGVQLFLCIDRIEPRAGGTLVAAGLPALVDSIRRRKGPGWPGRSQDVRRALRAEVPWFRALCSLRPDEDRIARFVCQATEEGGAKLQIVELTGEAGDVHVMHPWMVHGLSPNCGSRPRMALTARIHARGGGAPRGGVVKGGGLGAASTAGDARESPRSSVPRDPGPASEAGG